MHGKKKINLDIQIEFLASYISSTGQINKNVVLGSFSLILPGVALQNKNACKKYEGTPLDGWSFIVPRSCGFKKEGNNLKPIYSQGSYAINVTVKEISKTKYINKLLADKSNTVIDVTQKGVMLKFSNNSNGGGGSSDGGGGNKKGK